MFKSLLAQVGNHVFARLIFCWVLAVATSASLKAQAPAPAFGQTDCLSQTITGPGPAVTYQLRGKTSITNIPANSSSAAVTFTFQKKTNGVWGMVYTVTPSAQPVVNGTATFDTLYFNFNPAVAEEWRVLVNGGYPTGPPSKLNTVPGVASTAITPRP